MKRGKVKSQDQPPLFLLPPPSCPSRKSELRHKTHAEAIRSTFHYERTSLSQKSVQNKLVHDPFRTKYSGSRLRRKLFLICPWFLCEWLMFIFLSLGYTADISHNFSSIYTSSSGAEQNMRTNQPGNGDVFRSDLLLYIKQCTDVIGWSVIIWPTVYTG